MLTCYYHIVQESFCSAYAPFLICYLALRRLIAGGRLPPVRPPPTRWEALQARKYILNQ